MTLPVTILVTFAEFCWMVCKHCEIQDGGSTTAGSCQKMDIFLKKGNGWKRKWPKVLFSLYKIRIFIQIKKHANED